MLPWAKSIMEMNVKKVVLIASLYPPFPKNVLSLWGGIEVASEQFVESLRKKEINISIISLDFVVPVSEDKENIYRVGVTNPYLLQPSLASGISFVYKEFFRPIIFLKIYRYLAKEKPDVVIIGKTYQMSFSPYLAALILHIPYIIRYDWLCPTNPKPELCSLKDRFKCAICIQERTHKRIPKLAQLLSGPYFILLSLLKSYFWNKAYKILAVSEFHKQLMESFGIRHDKIEVVPERVSPVEVDPEIIKEIEEKYKHNNSFIILYVGRLEPEKGLSILIEAFRDLYEKDPSFKLLVVGAGRLTRLIEEESKKNQNVIYVGQIPHDQIGNYYAISDVVVIPSIVPEGHPLVVEEALLMKKPIIGFELGSLPEIIHNSSEGELVKEIDSKALANAIFSLRKRILLEKSNQ